MRVWPTFVLVKMMAPAARTGMDQTLSVSNKATTYSKLPKPSLSGQFGLPKRNNPWWCPIPRRAIGPTHRQKDVADD
jgi:hypothetical protein